MFPPQKKLCRLLRKEYSMQIIWKWNNDTSYTCNTFWIMTSTNDIPQHLISRVRPVALFLYCIWTLFVSSESFKSDSDFGQRCMQTCLAHGESRTMLLHSVVAGVCVTGCSLTCGEQHLLVSGWLQASEREKWLSLWVRVSMGVNPHSCEKQDECCRTLHRTDIQHNHMFKWKKGKNETIKRHTDWYVLQYTHTFGW